MMNNFRNFEEAGKSVLQFLHQQFGFELWMITRVQDNDWIVLQAEDHGYNIKAGDVFKWNESFCYHMVQGYPRIAPDAKKIDLYANAKINQLVKINAYIGQPLYHKDGSLFGTLCAIDPHQQEKTIEQNADLLNLLGLLLSYILQSELNEVENKRTVERLEVEAMTDVLTQLYNRRAWKKLVAAEEERCKLYGYSASVLIIDLNGLKQVNDDDGHFAGDQLIQKTAQILKNNVRPQDVVARLGGDEFGILSIETTEFASKKLAQRILAALNKENISAAIGYAQRYANSDLIDAIRQADQNMYQHKKQFK